MSIRIACVLLMIGLVFGPTPVARADELLVNGDFETTYGASQLGEDVTFAVTVDSTSTSDWETICVGDWVRGALGNWQNDPDGTGNDSDYVAVVRKPAGTMQAATKDAVSSGDTLKLNWDYHVPTGLTVGPTFTFRIFGVNEATGAETDTDFNDTSTTVDATSTVSGETANYEEIGNVSLTIDASDQDNGAWQSASESTFTVDDDWDYIVLIFGRYSGDNNKSGNEIDNISLWAEAANVAPTADAGVDQTVTDSDDSGSESVTLDGSGSSDSDGSIVSYVWEENSSQIATGSGPNVSFSVAVHTVTLIVTDDDDDTDTDSVLITVNEAPNTAPTADAGVDGTITMPANAALDGTVADDGKPNPPATVTTTWSTVSGPGTVTFADGSAVDTTATFTESGTYVLRLTADDSVLSDTDDVTITVNAATGGDVTSTGTWQNTSITSMTDDFTAEFDVVPHLNDMDGVVGIANAAAAAYNDVACIFRFNTSGNMDVRDGDAYASDTTLAYTAGVSYAVRMEIDIANHTYSVYVTPSGQSETTLATDYDFRTAQNQVTSLNYWSIKRESGSHTVSNMTITPANVAPTADAGTDQTVNDADDSGSESVTLDGSGSTDSDGTISSYVWKESSSQIATGSGPSVSFTVAAHTVELTVTDDDDATDTDTVLITITEYVNIAPTADAGTDQTVNDADDSGGESVTLDGSGSTDSDGTISSYVWKESSSQIATGSGPSVSFSVAAHTVELTVTDDDSATDTDTVLITVTVYVNLAPTADAGTDQTVTDTDDSGSESVTLDGSGSTDSDGTISSYVWKENSSQIATGSGPSVSFPVGGHTVELTVTDDDSATDTDTVSITVEAAPSGDPVELLVNGEFETTYGGSSTLGVDVTIPVTVDSSGSSDWETICVGDWVRGAAGNWQNDPDGTGNASDYVAVVRKPAGTMQVATKDAVSSGDTLKLNWDYHVPTGLTVGPTFTFRIFGVNEATGAETATEFNNTSTAVDATTTVSGETANYEEIGNVSLTISASDSNNGSWQSASESTFTVDDDWDYIVIIFGRYSGDNNISGNEIDNISLTATSASGNQAPTADAGPDQTVTDTDGNGSQSVTLDGTGSSDSDGSISSYVWTESSTQIATGSGPAVTLDTGVHTITLTVTDDDSDTDTDTVAITVNVPPTADAGSDQTVTDTDDGGSESVTLDGSGSTDSDGTISSYVWKENSSQIATGSGPSVSFSVGSHTVELTVTDDDSATDTDTVAITVNSGSTGSLLYPGSSWDGTAGSGYSSTPTESTTQIGSGTAKAIALWDVVPRQMIDSDFKIGVVAFHHEGIDEVQFLCEGRTVTVTEMTYNSRTDVTEYHATLDVSDFDNGANGDGRITLYARVIPNSGYERLLTMDMFCNVDGTLYSGEAGTILYVDGTNGDDSRTVTQAQSSSTPVQSVKAAMNLARTLASNGSYGGNGVIIEILTAGFYNLNRPLTNLNESWIIIRPTATLDRDDVVVGADGTETEWPSLNLKASYVKFEDVTFDVSYWTSMSGHWAERCLYTDGYGSWHSGASNLVDWDASTRTLSRDAYFTGYDHAARAAADQNYVWIRGGDSNITPGIYEVESKTSDNAVVLTTSISSVDITDDVDFGRGHGILKTHAIGYATNCDFIDIGSGPNKFVIVRNCFGEWNTGDFIKEFKLVINTTVKNFRGAWTGASGLNHHSDIFQRVAATNNSIIYGAKVFNTDQSTQLMFWENSTSTIGGNGQHDNWALVNNLFECDGDVDNGPLTQFCRTSSHVVMVNNTFIGQKTLFRNGGAETFAPENALISQNIFEKLLFTEGNLDDAVMDDNHYIEGSAPTDDANATTGGTFSTLFNDTANDDYTPISSTLTDRATPFVPVDMDGVTRSDPTAIGALEE